MKLSSIGKRITITTGLAILLIGVIIMGFSALSQRQTLTDHYLFQASVVSQTLAGAAGTDRLNTRRPNGLQPGRTRNTRRRRSC